MDDLTPETPEVEAEPVEASEPKAKKKILARLAAR
jgi:hypothetical protein